ncbi:MAG: hypothetical protein AMXMBFR13_50770 [Phycisphaerae bacterium]
MAKKKAVPESTASKLVLPACLLAVILVPLAFWLFLRSPEDLLKADPPTEAQIREIATRLLIDSDIKMRQQAGDKLVKTGEKAVPVLKDVCRHHDDPEVRSAVVQILASINVQAASEIVSELLNSQDERVRLIAMEAVGRLDASASGAAIQKGLADAAAGVRLSAVEAAARRRDLTAVPALERALSDESIRVRRHANKTLRNLTGRDYSDRMRAQGNR